MAAQPSVLVLGVDTQIGLTVVRELGRHGARVIGIAGSWRGIGLYSKYVRVRAVSPARDEARLTLIRRLAAEHEIEFLMAVSEPDLLWLNQHRDALSGIRLLIPSEDRLRLVIDKARVYSLAAELGIPTPRMAQPTSIADVKELAATAEYPVVLKWARPNDVVPILTRAGLPVLKLEYGYDSDDLVRRLERYVPVGMFPLVQEYCPGVGLGHMVLMQGGSPGLVFRHRRIREWPPEGGFSTICESLPADPRDPLLRGSIELLQAIGWQGPAMVEYRFDERTGEAVLMEINGRFWGSIPLAFHAGAHFAWGTLSALGLGHTAQPAQYRTGVRCMSVIPELKRLARVLFSPHKIEDRQLQFAPWREIRLFLSLLISPRTRYFVFWPPDPLPAIVDMATTLGTACRRLAGRVVARRRAA